MKYNIKIGEKTYAVEIDDINKRPIVARVDGQEFEVNPDMDSPVQSRNLPESLPLQHETPTGANLAGNTMTAPLPGIVIEVFVKPGELVEAGQVILIIEAMKMKNSIRSIRDGVVASVQVSAGQTVSHKQVLVEFEE